MKSVLKTIKWWEALILFQILLFLSHFITNSQIWPEVKDFEFDLKSFLIYNQAIQSLYHWGKFLIVAIIIFSGTYLMNKTVRFLDILKFTILSELVYFIPNILLFISFFLLKHNYTESTIANAFHGKFHTILNLSDGSLGYAFAKSVSIIDLIYFLALFLTINATTNLNRKEAGKIIGLSYAPAFFIFVMVNVLFFYL